MRPRLDFEPGLFGSDRGYLPRDLDSDLGRLITAAALPDAIGQRHVQCSTRADVSALLGLVQLGGADSNRSADRAELPRLQRQRRVSDQHVDERAADRLLVRFLAWTAPLARVVVSGSRFP